MYWMHIDPHGTVTDETGFSHEVIDLCQILCLGVLMNFSATILHARLTLTQSEAEYGYLYSHGYSLQNQGALAAGTVCTGSSDAGKILGELTSMVLFDSASVMLTEVFLYNLKNYFSSEYSLGGPHRRVKRIGNSGKEINISAEIVGSDYVFSALITYINNKRKLHLPNGIQIKMLTLK